MSTEEKGQESLLRVAEAIADRSSVDWEQEQVATGDSGAPWRELRTIESIIAFYALEETTQAQTPSLWVEEPGEGGADLPNQWGSLIMRGRIGQGACATVFRAYDPNLDREVALKLPRRRNPSFSRAFLREARRLARIHHENVVQVHGAEEYDDRVGMWMDLVEGRTLEECLSKQGLFSAGEAALIGIDLCRALAAVHGADLVHRDLKAANVMREQGGRIVLMDFSSVVEQQAEQAMVEDSSTQGTPNYMAPEVLIGSAFSTASDIYSLGVLLYRLVSGRYPVEAKSRSELCDLHRNQWPVSLLDVRPDLPVSFVQVIDRAVAADPEERYRSAGEMERALSGLTQSVDPRPGPDPNPRPYGRWLAGLAALLVLAIGAMVLVKALLPAPLSVEAALYRKGEVADERLDSGDQLALGDRLFLEVSGSRPIYAYVLNEDRFRRRFRLFPLEELVLTNPLPARVLHRLPGVILVEEAEAKADLERYWQVDTGGGEETLMLIASTRPLEDLEARLAEISPAGGPADAEERTFRGIGSLSADPRERPQLSLEELRSELEESSGSEVRVWQISLGNPAGDSVTEP